MLAQIASDVPFGRAITPVMDAAAIAQVSQWDARRESASLGRRRHDEVRGFNAAATGRG